jgi:hypothetical protein
VKNGVTADVMVKALADVKKTIREKCPTIKQIYIETVEDKS